MKRKGRKRFVGRKRGMRTMTKKRRTIRRMGQSKERWDSQIRQEARTDEKETKAKSSNMDAPSLSSPAMELGVLETLTAPLARS